MKIEGSVALVTGANRGLGAAFCRSSSTEARPRCTPAPATSTASTTTASSPCSSTSPQRDIAAAAASCGDVTLLVNNAGIGTGTSALADDALDAARREFETNVYGPLALSRAFAPALAANGGGAIVNVLSVLSWISMPTTAIYCASKAAGWSLTNSLRQELIAQHTQVLGLYVGYMDTDMTAGINAPKSDPVAVAHQTLDGIEPEHTKCSPTTSAGTSAAHSPATSSPCTHNSSGDRTFRLRWTHPCGAASGSSYQPARRR